MKKVFYPLACCCLAAGVFASCGGQKKANAQEEPSKVALSYSKSLKAPETDSLNLPVDENGYITIFDGETFNGWRGYGKDRVPTKGTIEDGCIKFNGSMPCGARGAGAWGNGWTAGSGIGNPPMPLWRSGAGRTPPWRRPPGGILRRSPCWRSWTGTRCSLRWGGKRRGSMGRCWPTCPGGGGAARFLLRS